MTAAERALSLRRNIHQSVFTPAGVSSPPPQPPPPPSDRPFCWDEHAKLLPGVTEHRADSLSQWTIQQVADFVVQLPGCAELGRVFRSQVFVFFCGKAVVRDKDLYVSFF